ncbi:MAG: DUF4340 domain-containing protein [Hymenobacteraceae bacterium]|nr:DUF4340 domain-containing protein [Hymenobacteraceae bacterium]
MNSRNRIYLLLALLVLLGAGTWWLSHRAERADSTLDIAATTFSVTDTAAVDKIFVALRSGQQHTLRRVARNYWRLDERYDARPDMVRMLLTTLHRQRVKSPVPRAARNTIVRALAGSGTKVEVYQQGQPTTTFYVGGTTTDRVGTYMILDGAEDPYITHIPGFEGFLTTRYLLTPREWRTIPVFTTPLPALEGIEVLAPGQPERAFVVRRAGRGFAIDGLPQADTARVRAYAAQFGHLNGQNFVDSTVRAKVDSVMRQPPGFIVTVRGRGQARPERIRLWALKGNQDSMVGQTDRDSAEAMIVQTRLFDQVLVKRADFVPKPK